MRYFAPSVVAKLQNLKSLMAIFLFAIVAVGCGKTQPT